MKKFWAEFIGTFMLIFVGTGAVVIANRGAGAVGVFGIAMAFGLTITIMASAVGNISGGHFNPAVSIAMLINGRITVKEAVSYLVAQFLGATAASGIILFFVSSMKYSKKQLGQTVYAKINTWQAFLVEMIITFLFIFVILMVTSQKFGNATMAPFAIGLMLAMMIIVAVNMTGASLNPARSFGPAILAGGKALKEYWLYLLAPICGGILAAIATRLLGAEEK